MKITSIKLKDVDVLKISTDAELDIDPNINIILGKNGSGKTRLLQAIASANNVQSGPIEGIKEAEENVDIIMQVKDSETEVTGKIMRLKNGQWNSNYLVHKKIHYIGVGRSLTNTMDKNKIFMDLSNRDSNVDLSEQINIAEDLNNNVIRALLDKFSSVGDDIQSITDKLEEEYSDSLIDFEKELKIDFDSQNPIYFLDHNNNRVDPMTLSDGEKQFLYFFTFLRRVNRYKDRIILIDEPEIHLHSTQIKKLCEMIQEISDNNQIFIATHSSDILQYFQNRAKLHLISKGRATTIQLPEELSKAVSEIGFVIDPSFFTSKWICMENSKESTFPGANAINTVQLMRWLFGTNVYNRYWTFGSNKRSVEVIESTFKEISEESNTKFIIILDGDKLFHTNVQIPNIPKRTSRLIYLPLWEIENLFINPYILKSLEINDFWEEVEKQKETLVKSMTKTYIKNTLRKDFWKDNHIKGSDPIQEFDKWKGKVADLTFVDSEHQQLFDDIVTNKNWKWLPGKEVFKRIVLKKKNNYWSDLTHDLFKESIFKDEDLNELTQHIIGA